MSLTTKTKYVCGVVRLPDKPLTRDDALNLAGYFKASGAENYFVILHSRDVDANGEFITPHLHFVAILGNAPRLSTTLNAVADALRVPCLSVSIQKASSIEASVQYLLHKHNPEKAQYAECELYTDANSTLLQLYLNAEASGNVYHDIKIAIATSDTLSDVVDKLGFKTYNAYRATIKDLWQDKITHGYR